MYVLSGRIYTVMGTLPDCTFRNISSAAVSCVSENWIWTLKVASRGTMRADGVADAKEAATTCCLSRMKILALD